MTSANVAFNGIREYIAEGVFQPGSKLPSEDQLCKMLGMSRSPVREALRMLDALNVIEIRHGSGSYVRSLSAESLIGSLSLTMGLMPLNSLLSAYELRITVESSVAERASARIDTDQLAELDELQDQIEACRDPHESVDIDDRFHQKIADIASSPASKAFLDVLRSRSRNYSLYDLDTEHSIFRASNMGHRAIIEALKNRDPQMAKSAMASHVEMTRHWLEALQLELQSEHISPLDAD
ncbi:MAG: FadR/GntR family transcriptional regulator [Bifidobacterium sp.]|uniref:FadR/GntR family transcriptional regulator n=1 Tax=Bifidobacterium sp. TaxID=41200 RepID=UPI0039EB58C0